MEQAVRELTTEEEHAGEAAALRDVAPTADAPCTDCLNPHPRWEPRDCSHNDNPSDIGFLGLLVEDYLTYERVLLEPCFWAVMLHRLGNWRMSVPTRILRLPFKIVYKIGQMGLSWFCGIYICDTTRLGRRVRIWHHGATFLSAVSIGNDVHIRQCTTFGVVSRLDPDQSKPIIEDRVDVGAGVCILGNVTVGHDSVIGANSVVVRDIPPHSTVFGVPARPVNLKSPSRPRSSTS